VSGRTPRLPPRWLIRLAWKVHRALFKVTGRGLWRARADRWGTVRLTATGRRSGEERSVILSYIEDGPNLVTLAMIPRPQGAGRCPQAGARPNPRGG
jgi:hypothetical protein